MDGVVDDVIGDGVGCISLVFHVDDPAGTIEIDVSNPFDSFLYDGNWTGLGATGCCCCGCCLLAVLDFRPNNNRPDAFLLPADDELGVDLNAPLRFKEENFGRDTDT